MSMYDKSVGKEERASLEFAEGQRETEWKYPSFALELFHGRFDTKLIHPFPDQSPEDKRKGDAYLEKLEKFLIEELDPNQIDRDCVIPDKVLNGLAELKAFAMKIPEEYGGMGLSQVNYNRAIHLISSYCGSTAVVLSAHQSIGVPEPLKQFGTKEQKMKYFPKFVDGMISAFALTEPNAGSDPRNMSTAATPSEDGSHYILNGEKLWCTNGLIAGVIAVMAVTPPKIVKGKERKQITAFIVETDSPGFEIVNRCVFMGLHGIQIGLIRFKNLKVPKENIIIGEGQGLKLALTILNTGRLTLPAASVGIGKWCLYVSREWSKERVQWGTPIGEHESIALKLADMAAYTFAMDAMTWMTSFMADDKHKDIRIEAAIAKYFCTHHSYRIANETLQIRAGSGYETSDSLKKRGVKSWAVERTLRDARVNEIIEGTSEIMHLFIAREALDPHLNRTKALLTSKTSVGEKLKAVLGIIVYYVPWYISLWMPVFASQTDMHPKLDRHMRYVKRTSKRLARLVIHKMGKHQKKMATKQSVVNRIVDIGTELFAMATACSYADHLVKSGGGKDNALDLADLYCLEARKQIESFFKDSCRNHDKESLSVSKKLMADKYEWLENDIIKMA
ncbi:MAG: acyl-CoA dehydrogenase family protein [Candidatus Omnitrophica bacterium]|nr:acyl-CoA dehydrogenase family protein [Candidatus Omnitrophota bacterium]